MCMLQAKCSLHNLQCDQFSSSFEFWIINFILHVFIIFLSFFYAIKYSSPRYSSLTYLLDFVVYKKLLRNSLRFNSVHCTRITSTTISQWNLIIQQKPMRNYWNTTTYVCYRISHSKYYVFKNTRCLLFYTIQVDPSKITEIWQLWFTLQKSHFENINSCISRKNIYIYKQLRILFWVENLPWFCLFFFDCFIKSELFFFG